MDISNDGISKDEYAIEPIKSLKTVGLIKNMLTNSPRGNALFCVGVSSNISAEELINIKISQIESLLNGNPLAITDKKNHKARELNLTKEAHEALDQLMFHLIPFKTDDYLFRSDGLGQMTLDDVNTRVQTWCNKVNLKGNYSALSLRKTWAYIQKTVYDVDIETIKLCLKIDSIEKVKKYLHL